MIKTTIKNMRIKTIFYTMIVLFLNISLKAQISNKQLRSVQLDNNLRLPLLTATNLDKNKKLLSRDFILKNYPKNSATIVPNAYSTSNGANYKLTAKKHWIPGAGLDYKGRFDSYTRTIRIEPNNSQKLRDFLSFYFDAKKNKSYRIKMKLQIGCTGLGNNSMLILEMGGASTGLSVKPGTNFLDFIVKSEYGGYVLVKTLFNQNLFSSGKPVSEDLHYTFYELEIRELQD